MAEPDLDFVLRVLRAFAMSPNDSNDMLLWRTDGKYAPITFMANCSDLFDWATADCEVITPENVGELERAFADVKAVSPTWQYEGVNLFCARVRGRRPQRPAYPKDEALWPLFDAAGPVRRG